MIKKDYKRIIKEEFYFLFIFVSIFVLSKFSKYCIVKELSVFLFVKYKHYEILCPYS